MRPLIVEFSAFGPYPGYEKVDFEDLASKGLFLICGKTGKGKTMILDAMTFALYGKSSGHGRDSFEAMRCTNAEDNVDTFVKFTFESKGEVYVFTRTLSKKRTRFAAEFSAVKIDKAGNSTVLFENAREKDLNGLARELIGLEYEQFRQVIVLPQGQFERLLVSNSDEKEKILTSIFEGDKWKNVVDKMYEEVTGKKKALDDKLLRVKLLLQDEECEDVEELKSKIDTSVIRLETLKKQEKEGEYDKRVNSLRESLAVVEKFANLRDSERKLAKLVEEEPYIDALRDRLTGLRKAEKVKAYLIALDSAKADMTLREEECIKIKSDWLRSEEDMQAAGREMEQHTGAASVNEELVGRRKLYELRTSEYERVDELTLQYKSSCDELKRITEKEEKDRAALKAAEGALQTAEAEYTNIRKEHDRIRAAYIKGITGILASELTEGEPCPVCGSREHPAKAVSGDINVSSMELDDAKAEEDLAYENLNDKRRLMEEAKAELDINKSLTDSVKDRNLALGEQLKHVREGLIEGIDSLASLRKAVDDLDAQIKEYNERTVSLREEYEEASRKHSALRARFEAGELELKKASQAYSLAVEALNDIMTQNGFGSIEEVRDKVADLDNGEALTEKVNSYESALKAAGEVVATHSAAVEGLTEPDEDKVREALAQADKERLELSSEMGALEAMIDHLEKRLADIEEDLTGTEEERIRLEDDLAFLKKVRGDTGIGLQRYVLGIRFASVIEAANAMLEKVHGGRYVLFRTDEKGQNSNKRGLELKVFDKHSGLTEGRSVSTLSGGEKFLASLALSIGMSTIARGSGIKVEALFIDEGFGSLDEDSITDAMDVLNAIKEANGMVGIISHVQLLQERITSKLIVKDNEKGSYITRSIG
ncbi:MAG: SMC family ATPase [Lachnospiraceae bacterium]|nr:SMC family ATPase [Lachnospiraceae bacterium]